jgi:hypothetical protein
MRHAALRAFIVALLGLSQCAMADAQYKLAGGVNGGGGGVMSGVANRIIGTIGQPVTGRESGTSNKASLGFWYAQTMLVTSVSPGEHALPMVYGLDQNYPNPFNPSTVISYRLPQSGRVKLVVFDLLGREVALLAQGVQDAGIHTASWNAVRAASGVYFYRLEVFSADGSRKFVSTRNLVVLR